MEFERWQAAALWTAAIFSVAVGCGRAPRHAVESSASADVSLLEYIAPERVSLSTIEARELGDASPVIARLLEKSNQLVQRGVGYRAGRHPRLSRQRLTSDEPQLSCSEFVWYVLALSGLDTGNHHLETRDLAYARQVYPHALERVRDGSFRAGDLLVYEYPLQDLQRDERETGHYRSGHAVIVVSADERIVVGSHYCASTPEGAPTGVGYRRLVGGWERWTADRRLSAVYRIKNAWADERPLATGRPVTAALRGERLTASAP